MLLWAVDFTILINLSVIHVHFQHSNHLKNNILYLGDISLSVFSDYYARGMPRDGTNTTEVFGEVLTLGAEYGTQRFYCRHVCMATDGVYYWLECQILRPKIRESYF